MLGSRDKEVRRNKTLTMSIVIGVLDVTVVPPVL